MLNFGIFCNFKNSWFCWFRKMPIFAEKLILKRNVAIKSIEHQEISISQEPKFQLWPPAEQESAETVFSDNRMHKLLRISNKSANFQVNSSTLNVFFSLSKWAIEKISKVPESPGTWPVITDQLPDSDLRPKILSLKSEVSSMNLRDESLGRARPS